MYTSTIQSVRIFIMCAGAVSMTMAVPPNIAPPLYISPTAVDLNFLLKDSARNTGRDENISASRNNWIENTDAYSHNPGSYNTFNQAAFKRNRGI